MNSVKTWATAALQVGMAGVAVVLLPVWVTLLAIAGILFWPTASGVGEGS